jgi:hypothetical protein
VPLGRGALWTGLGADDAFRLGLQRERFTIEMTRDGQNLNKGALKQELDRDFGPGWGDQKKLIWTWASQKFVSRMSGPVDVFMKAGSTRTAEGMSISDLKKIEGKILFDELMDMKISGQVVGNRNISSIQITEFDEKLTPTNTYTVPISKESN